MNPLTACQTLPQKYKDNWHISLAIRTDLQTRYALSVAGSPAPAGLNDSGWVEAFDAASRDWLSANPMEPHWSSGQWPEGAEVYLGHKALEEARKSVGIHPD